MLLLATGQLQQCLLPSCGELLLLQPSSICLLVLSLAQDMLFAHLHMRATSPNSSLNPGIGAAARSQMAKRMLPNTWPHTQPSTDTKLTDM